PLAMVMSGLAATLLVISAAIAIHHPPTGYDELGYHAPLAVFFWSDGSLSQFLARFPGTWALAQPGSAELWFGLLRIIGGEPLAAPGARSPRGARAVPAGRWAVVAAQPGHVLQSAVPVGSARLRSRHLADPAGHEGPQPRPGNVAVAALPVPRAAAPRFGPG